MAYQRKYTDEYKDDLKKRREATKEYDLIQLAEDLGYTPIRKGDRYFTLQEHDSVMIRLTNNTFYRYATHTGGDPVAFLMELGIEQNSQFSSVSYCIGYLEKRMNIKVDKAYVRKTYHVEKKGFMLPEKDKDYRRLFAYLTKTRGIDQQVVATLIYNKILYQEKKHKNIVFVGYDYDVENPKAVYGMQRGTLPEKRFMQEMEGNNYDYGISYIVPNKRTLIVTESAIDMMSVMCLFNNGMKIANYLALGGVSKDRSIYKYLEHFSHISKVVLCLDNDDAGREATKRIEQHIKEHYPDIKVDTSFVPRNKDFNEDLIEKRKFEEELKTVISIPETDKEEMKIFLNQCIQDEEFNELMKEVQTTYNQKEKHYEAIHQLKNYLFKQSREYVSEYGLEK